MSPIDQYKLPLSEIDVKSLVDTLIKYNCIFTEDSQFLMAHPVARDECLAKIESHQDTKESVFATHLVGPGLPLSEYDKFLATVDEAIAALTPPHSIEDRVLRAHLATSAFMVFSEYKVAYATADHPSVFLEIAVALTNEASAWQLRRFPELGHRPVRPATTEVRRERRKNRPRGTRPITGEQVAEFVAHPYLMLKKRFYCEPPQGVEDDYVGAWRVESYVTQILDDEVDHEFKVFLSSMGGEPVPMDTREIEYILRWSSVFV